MKTIKIALVILSILLGLAATLLVTRIGCDVAMPTIKIHVEHSGHIEER